MKYIFLFFTVFLISSCGQDYNSNYNDRGTYADIGIAPGTTLYNAYLVLQNKCFSCHGNQWSSYTTSQQWINAGLITQANYNASLIKTRLKNYGGNMPPDPTSALSSSEIETLKTWINSP